MTLTATPGARSLFDGFTGDRGGTTCWEPGPVTAPGINCGTDCDEPYAASTPITLIAMPSSGHGVYEWTGTGVARAPGATSCVVTMSAARMVGVQEQLQRLVRRRHQCGALRDPSIEPVQRHQQPVHDRRPATTSSSCGRSSRRARIRRWGSRSASSARGSAAGLLLAQLEALHGLEPGRARAVGLLGSPLLARG